MKMINKIQTAQQLQNHLKSQNIAPARVPSDKTPLESFRDILKNAMRGEARCKSAGTP